jgi:hypothetical protein
MRPALLLTALLACGPQSSISDSSGGETADPTTGDSTTDDSTTDGATTGSTAPTPTSGGGDSTTGALVEPCTCNADEYCPGMLNDCAAPTPCGKVDETNAEPTDCVLAQMVAPTFFQFSYCHMCGGYESYEGTFVVFGPQGGVDVLCHRIDFHQDLQVRAHASEPPSYFKECQALVGWSARRACLLNGFKPGDLLPQCE